jgi:putative acetyltransferase
MEIRAEQTTDIESIHQVNLAAFGRKSEADLVDQLRGIPSTFSFVAIKSQQIVGHIFFSPVEIVGGNDEDLHILGLAPVAVLPDFQRQEIGTLLIQHGLTECDRLGFQAIVLLGSPKFYSRFGFVTAKQKRLECEFSVPDEAFMVLELETGALDRSFGKVKYRSEFIL